MYIRTRAREREREFGFFVVPRKLERICGLLLFRLWCNMYIDQCYQYTSWIIQCLTFNAFGSINKSLGFVDKWLKRFCSCSVYKVYRTQKIATHIWTSANNNSNTNTNNNNNDKEALRFFTLRKNTSRCCWMYVYTVYQKVNEKLSHIYSIYPMLPFCCQSNKFILRKEPLWFLLFSIWCVIHAT